MQLVHYLRTSLALKVSGFAFSSYMPLPRRHSLHISDSSALASESLLLVAMMRAMLRTGTLDEALDGVV